MLRGCYGRRVITVAAAETEENAHTLVHEYGHHVDASRGVADAPEPNGSSTWWRARGMARLVELRSAYQGYVRGWDRNIAEIFAEDYARLARPGQPAQDHMARGAERGGARRDPPRPRAWARSRRSRRPPQLKPVSETRRGRLAPGRTVAFDPFGLLGSGRRVRATVEMRRLPRPRASAHGSSSTATARGSPPARSDEA